MTVLHIQNKGRLLVQALSNPGPPITNSNRLVLVGGGHAHAQVIKALKVRPKNLHVTVIDSQTTATYSGMVPGCMANLYTPAQTLIHLEPLCNWANIEFIQDEVVDMDLDNQFISLKHAPHPVPYDAVSLDIGSKSRGLDDTPGAREFTIPTRPISKLVERIEAAEKLFEERQGTAASVVVVGGGAAGIELAMSIRGRWNSLLGDNLKITLLDAGEGLLPNETPANRQALQTILKHRDIKVLHNCHVEQITASHVVMEGDTNNHDDGASIPYTHCLWAAGAASHPLAGKLENQGLAVSNRGWIRVNDCLQSLSHPNIFAAGDCCTIEGLSGGKASPPKAGVYAVRSGPVLIENLTRFVQKEQLINYEPQDDFLKLLACGDGTALGFRFGVPLYGKWVFKMKDHIDQLFVNLFQKENLPDILGDVPDKSDFDALDEDGRVQLNPQDAALLLQRTDEKVDYLMAWHAIRDMTKDEVYCRNVLACFKQKVCAQ